MGYVDGMNNEETLNMLQVTMKEFNEFIVDAIEMENFDSPILCLGKSGIGKTESVRETAVKKLKIGFIEFRLASYSETDLAGIPYFVDGKKAGTKYTKFADMGKLPHLASTGEGDDPDVGILLLDELPAASREVRTVALQLMDSSRSIGDYTLPPKWLIVALGNGPTDGGVFNGLEYALISRAMCLRVNPDFDIWKTWALQNDVHPAVIGFIHQNGGTDMLHKIKNQDDGGYEEKECNPRSWVKLSTCLNKKEERVGSLSERHVEIYSGAAVGANLAYQFSTYYKFKEKLIPIEDILSGKALDMDIRNRGIETMYMQSSTVVQAMNRLLIENSETIRNQTFPHGKALEHIRNIILWIIKTDSFRPDLAISTIADITSTNGDFYNLYIMEEMDDLIPEYCEYVTKRSELMQGLRAYSR